MAAHVQFDRNKLKAVILHVCQEIPADRLGAVKLHKVLYFLDMISYAQSGRAVTGAEYRKRPFGPTCVPLLPTLRDMQRDGDLRIEETDYFGWRKTSYIALRETDRRYLTADEIALLDEVADYVCNQNSARSISELSHQRPWEQARFGDVIGYETALLLFPAQPSAEAMDIVARGAAQGEDARSSNDAVGRTHYRDFRSRVLASLGRA